MNRELSLDDSHLEQGNSSPGEPMSVVEVRGKFPLHRDQPERSCRTSRMEANAGIQPGTESSAKGTEGNESMKEMSEG